MELVDGLKQLQCLVKGLENNVEKDGIIIYLHMLLNNLGVIWKNGLFIYGMLSMEINGLKQLINWMDELIIRLKIIGIQL